MASASKLVRTEISLEGNDLEVGQTVTILCPSCQGGNSQAKSLSITKKDNGNIVFICFRDNCQIKGFIKASGFIYPVDKAPEKIKKPKEVRVAKLMAARLDPIPSPTELLIREKYSVSLTESFCRWDPSTERVLFPIFDETVDLRGYVARSYTGAEPKALTYKEEGYSGAAWFQTGFVPTKALIVVEDPVSAIAVMQFGIDAVALLGTNLSPETITQIQASNYTEVIVALDADAFVKCIENAQKLQQSKVLQLEKDIKDMNFKERKQLLAQYKQEVE